MHSAAEHFDLEKDIAIGALGWLDNDNEQSDAGDYWAEWAERVQAGEEDVVEEEWEWDGDDGSSDDALHDLRRQITVLAQQIEKLTDGDSEESTNGEEDLEEPIAEAIDPP